jgi:hypothetical protein
MSFSFAVKVRNGEASVELPAGHQVPDGNFTVNGHTQGDGKNHSIGIQQSDADGRLIASTQGYHA